MCIEVLQRLSRAAKNLPTFNYDMTVGFNFLLCEALDLDINNTPILFKIDSSGILNSMVIDDSIVDIEHARTVLLITWYILNDKRCTPFNFQTLKDILSQFDTIIELGCLDLETMRINREIKELTEVALDFFQLEQIFSKKNRIKR